MAGSPGRYPTRDVEALRRLRRWRSAQRAAKIDVAKEPADALLSDTLEKLEGLSFESFKRQVDLDESVWRSLPFIAATFAFVAAVVGRAASDLPRFELSMYGVTTRAFVFFAVASLAWTLRWFFDVLRRREYEYPAKDAAVRQYAVDMTAYHAALGLSGAELDEKVVEELRLFMIDQYGSAASANQAHNSKRFEGRTKVLLFILIGFVLAFSCEAVIFIHRDAYGSSEVESDKAAGQRHSGLVRDAGVVQRTSSGYPCGGRIQPMHCDQRLHSGTPERTEGAARDGGSQHLGATLEGKDPGEGVMAKGPVKPTAGSPPARPTAPPTQFLAKFQDASEVKVFRQPPPTPTPKSPPKKGS